MKKLTTMFLACVLSLALFIPAGCGRYVGEFYDLNEVYENGEISRQDLLSIIYHYHGNIIEENKEQYPEDFVPTPKDPEELDKKTEDIIAKAYKNKRGYKNKWKHSVFYYGTYGDYIAVVVQVQVPNVDYIEQIIYVTIDGVCYWTTPYSGYIYMYKK